MLMNREALHSLGRIPNAALIAAVLAARIQRIYG